MSVDTEALAIRSHGRTGRAATRRRPSRYLLARASTAFGAATIVVCTAALVALHLLPATSDLDPVSEPLSAYALTSDGTLFNTAILLLAAGVVAVLGALALQGRARWPVVTALAACASGLVALVLWPDVAGPDGLTDVGRVHWTASMVAFGAMPFAPLYVWQTHRRRNRRCYAATGCGLAGMAAYALFVLFFVGNVLAFVSPLPLWLLGGLFERLLAAIELTGAAVIAWWSWTGCECLRPAQ